MPTIGRTLATVKLGVHKTLENCRESLEVNSMKVKPSAEKVLKKTPLSQTPTDIEPIEVSVGELDFKKETRFDIICTRIVEQGFDLCPAETAIVLRESYKDQPKGEQLIIAMEGITVVDGYPNLFCIAHDEDGLWLRTRYGGPDYPFNPGERFVVARRKSRRSRAT